MKQMSLEPPMIPIARTGFRNNTVLAEPLKGFVRRNQCRSTFQVVNVNHGSVLPQKTSITIECVLTLYAYDSENRATMAVNGCVLAWNRPAATKPNVDERRRRIHQNRQTTSAADRNQHPLRSSHRAADSSGHSAPYNE